MEKLEILKDITIIYGDCYEAIKDIPNNSVDLVYIDIPYLIGSGIQISKPKENASAINKRISKVATQDLGKISSGIDYSILDELVRVLKHIYIYIWCSKGQIVDLLEYFVRDKGCNFNVLTWCKTNPVPATANSWLPDLEYCLIFKEPNSPKYNDGYELKSKWYLSPINKFDKDVWEHPTIKPLELVERHIKHSTNEGDVVLDCFMGSGTTGVACRNTKRKFIGIEIEKNYFEIAKKRITTQHEDLKLFD